MEHGEVITVGATIQPGTMNDILTRVHENDRRLLMDVEVKMKAFACTLQAASSKTLKRTNKNGTSNFVVELVLPIVNTHRFTPWSLFTHLLQFAD